METIQNGKLVALHFTLKDDTGETIETTKDYLPALYVHGQRQFPKGIETALEGRRTGDVIDSAIEPQQGFGLHNEALLQTLPLDLFESSGHKLEVGMQINATTESGEIPVRVVVVDEDTVTVDGNHAYAGKRLHLHAEIRNVRDATIEELRRL